MSGIKAVICVCRTIEDEINYVLEENKIDLPVIHMEAGLHENPAKLKSALQETIDGINNVDFVLLAYALCGNALLGLTSTKATLVLPQYHDCLAMLLGSDERYRANLGTEMGALFLTRGWMKHFNPKQKFYEDYVPRFGHKKALRFSKLCLANYKRFALIETEAYDQIGTFREMEEQAQFFDLQTHRIQGTLDVLRKLVKGQWDDSFRLFHQEARSNSGYNASAYLIPLSHTIMRSTCFMVFLHGSIYTTKKCRSWSQFSNDRHFLSLFIC